MPLRLELEIFTYAKVIERTAVPEKSGRAVFSYGFSLFKMSTQRVGILNYNPPASRVVTIVIRKNHLSVL